MTERKGKMAKGPEPEPAKAAIQHPNVAGDHRTKVSFGLDQRINTRTKAD